MPRCRAWECRAPAWECRAWECRAPARQLGFAKHINHNPHQDAVLKVAFNVKCQLIVELELDTPKLELDTPRLDTSALLLILESRSHEKNRFIFVAECYSSQRLIAIVS